ncbi:MAG: HAD-IA family hydrolase [Rubellimicrobium sp.]|nr:HAD-IA family hydrolase [Rubellimicrobium sp.]
MRSVIFDLDGTLADTSGDLIAAANAALAEAGLGPRLDPGADAGVAMRGGRAMLRLALARAGMDPGGAAEALVERAYPRLLAHYEGAICRQTRLYPGAMAAVGRLGALGYRVGVCTNKPEALAERLLVALGVRDAFASLVGADTLPVRKPDPAPLIEAVRRAGADPRRACLVGDSDTDRATAAAAGVPSILVTFGPEGAALAALAPAALVAHFDDLPAAVEALAL